MFRIILNGISSSSFLAYYPDFVPYIFVFISNYDPKTLYLIFKFQKNLKIQSLEILRPFLS
mgnify:CR=1 FL=1